MKPLDLSNYDPSSFNLDRLQTPAIIELIDSAGIITITKSDLQNEELPSYLPTPARSLENVTLENNGHLIFSFSDGNDIDVGDISKNIDFVYPTITGTGLYNGTNYVPLESTNTDFTITVNTESVELSIPDFTGGEFSGGMSIDQCSIFHDVGLAGFPGSSTVYQHGTSQSNTWNIREFATTVLNALTLPEPNVGIFSLNAGFYRIECNVRARLVGRTMLRIWNVTTGEEIIRGQTSEVTIEAQQTSIGLNDYFYLANAADIRIEQYTELAVATGAFGSAYRSELFGQTAIMGKLIFWRVGDVAPTYIPNIKQLNSFSSQWKDIYDVRQNEPMVVTDISHGAGAQYYYFVSKTIGNKTYFFPAHPNSLEVMVYDDVTEKTYYINIVPEVRAYITKNLSYTSAVVLGNDIWLVPYAASNPVLVFHADTETFTIKNYGLTTISSAYSDGVYDPISKKIIFVPLSAPSFFIIDTVADTATTSTFAFGSLPTTVTKYSGCCYANGFVYVTPYSATNVLKIDLVNMTAVVISTTAYSDTLKWWGCIYVPAVNKIVALPTNANDFLVIDCADDSMSRQTFGLSLIGTLKYRKGILSGNVITCLPLSAANTITIDVSTMTGTSHIAAYKSLSTYVESPDTQTASGKAIVVPGSNPDKIYRYRLGTEDYDTLPSGRVPLGTTISGTFKWAGGANSSGEFACFWPRELQFAIASNGNVLYPLYSSLIANTTHKFSGAVADPAGYVYSIPATATYMMRYVPPNIAGTARTPAYVDGSTQMYYATPELAEYNPGFYHARASSEFSATYPAWKAFQRNLTSVTQSDSWVSGNFPPSESSPQWVQITYPEPIPVSAYQIRNAYNYYIRTGRLIASNDGQNWEVLDVINLPTNSTAHELLPITNLTPTQNYKHYRLEFWSSSTNTYSAISELLLYTSQEYESFNFIGHIEKFMDFPTGSLKYSGGQYCTETDKVVLSPDGASAVGILDLNTKTLETKTYGADWSSRYNQPARIDTCKFIMASSIANEVRIIDILNETVRVLDTVEKGVSGSALWSNASVGNDNRVYVCPGTSNDKFGVYDSELDVFYYDTFNTGPFVGLTVGMCCGANGKMYSIPSSSTADVFEIDLYSYEGFNTDFSVTGTTGMSVPLLLKSGVIISLPYHTELHPIVIYPTNNTWSVPESLVIHPWINRS
jgi:hypothetical protein